MGERPDKERAEGIGEGARAAGTTSDPMASILELLRKELEYLRQDRDRLKDKLDQWDEREKQWDQERSHWQQERSQWQQQRDELKGEISDLKDKVKDLGLQLKTQTRKIPKSEKGAQLTGPASEGTDDGDDGSDSGAGDPAAAPDEDAPEHEADYLAELRRARPEPAIVLTEELPTKQDWWAMQGSDFECIPAPAEIFQSAIFVRSDEHRDFSFTADERQKIFGRERGLHSKKDESTVYQMNLGITKITCSQENLSDLHQGLYFRKANQLGPAGTQISWGSLARITVLVAEYAFPMERLARALGHSYFSSANISRWFIRSADAVLPVYVGLGKAFAKVNYLKMDDTSALVLDLRREAKTGLTPDRQMTGEEWETYLQARKEQRASGPDLVTPVLEAFGRVAQRADGKGAKISLNTTLISGRLNTDNYRSTAYFYRTHFGQAGNLLSRILEHRSANDRGELVIQGDSSAQNHLEKDLAQKVRVIHIGCSAHARRPFFRFRYRDKQLAFCMLRCFRVLATIESRIQNGPLTKARILRYRQRYSTSVWRIIESICQAVIEGRRHPLAWNSRWKKGDKLYDGCSYILNNLDELKYYLSHPEVSQDNNASEQGLRGEKLIENSAYFRKSETGRIALDIHRSLIASCNSCGLEYATYLQYVMESDAQAVAAKPARYFPHAVWARLNNRGPPCEEREKAPTVH